jgi:hypothetical protein
MLFLLRDEVTRTLDLNADSSFLSPVTCHDVDVIPR